MKVYNLNEISDSKVLYDKNPPKFMIFIIFIVTTLLAAFIIWSTKSIKTDIVKGTGIVTTDSKFNVMSKVSGEIDDVNIKEGQEVKVGDVLLTVKSADINYQSDQTQGQIDVLNKRIELLSRAEKDAERGENSFNKNNSDELEFYNRLHDNYARKDEYKINENDLKKQGYTDDQIKQYKDQSKTKLNELYYDTILSFTTEKKQLELEENKLESQKSALIRTSDEYKLFATTSGKIHLSSPLNKGMVLQAGSMIGTIANENDDKIVETLISGSDRPRVKIGDEVSMEIGGLSQIEYGTLKGKIVSVDEDATIDNEKGNIYFKAKIKPEKTYLKDKKGQVVGLSLGMVTETRVKYEKITYMKYFMEQIGINLN
ncbi:HlyD family secretion protein [Clostridium paridis]|uniref:HlyD family efflux transporter periplasmic adaptor subunit n=1 Tax=Clostridium paridis TaxID=2803863 RepID=A0A937FEE7_9CLOT|nr:HlyD family efflux transporter periplasmic adaptor subunit [Clostridium paridis]MBL4931804.1 HlyD family efflux transporter periplasmic adaptor subunit [Clostridium paridis]